MFSFRRITGSPVTIEECRAVLEQYGAIESIWYPSEDQTLVLHLHGAVLMQFAFFDDGRRAQQVSFFRHNPLNAEADQEIVGYPQRRRLSARFHYESPTVIPSIVWPSKPAKVSACARIPERV
jgi:hypothetical protein